MMFRLPGTAQEAGAGGRSGAVGIYSCSILASSREPKHHLTKA